MALNFCIHGVSVARSTRLCRRYRHPLRRLQRAGTANENCKLRLTLPSSSYFSLTFIVDMIRDQPWEEQETNIIFGPFCFLGYPVVCSLWVAQLRLLQKSRWNSKYETMAKCERKSIGLIQEPKDCIRLEFWNHWDICIWILFWNMNFKYWNCPILPRDVVNLERQSNRWRRLKDVESPHFKWPKRIPTVRPLDGKEREKKVNLVFSHA